MATLAPAPSGTIALDVRRLPRTLPWYVAVWGQMLRRKPLGTIGGAIVLGMLLLAVFADVLTPYGFAETNLRERFITTNTAHWLGTDQIGRDVATRILYGARISLYVGFGAVAIASVIATLLGILSAYWGGRVDILLQRIVDAWMAFPGLLILMSIMSLLGPSVLNITLVLGIATGLRDSRIVRGVALSIRENTYIESARAMGSGHTRVTFVHILPNVIPTIIVVATTGLSTVILTEAALSFLGLGVPEPYPSWGRMLSVSAAEYAQKAPYLVLFPGIAISLAVFGSNLLGDALRDTLDPRLRGA